MKLLVATTLLMLEIPVWLRGVFLRCIVNNFGDDLLLCGYAKKALIHDRAFFVGFIQLFEVKQLIDKEPFLFGHPPVYLVDRIHNRRYYIHTLPLMRFGYNEA